jgi:signal transduction histidine kinase
MSRLTLRGRVTLAAIAVLAMGLIALSVLFNVLLAHRLDADASDVLRSRAAAQLATLDLAHGGLRPVEGPNDAALDRDAWVFGAGRLIEQPAVTSAAQAHAVAALAGVSRPTERTIPGRIRVRAVPVRAPDGERRGTAVVGVSLVPYEHTRNIAFVGTALLSLLLLAGAALAVRWAVRSALQPIAEMTARAADWSEHDLHQRFHLGPARDELTSLAATFDGLLQRIEAVLRHEQRFSAEVAHELRTPLTGLRGEAELVLARPALDDESRAAFERVLESSARMETVIETLLASARMEESGRPAGSCDPLPAVREAVAAVANAARSHHVDVRLAEPAAQLTVDAGPEVVTQALYPLLENGVRHARGSVDVSLEPEGDLVTVAVRDDGPGLEGREPMSVFAPGVSSSGGAGLGLPLARRLARSCGGDVVVGAGEGGGRFELRLPGGSSCRPAG